jgi:hypothetical protein
MEEEEEEEEEDKWAENAIRSWETWNVPVLS